MKIYTPNDVIIREGDFGEEFYLIVAGKVSMFHRESLALLTELNVF